MAILTEDDRKRLAEKFCPWLVLFPENRERERPYYRGRGGWLGSFLALFGEESDEDPEIGDYHPIPVEFFLRHADRTTSPVRRRLPIGAKTLLLGRFCHKNTTIKDIQALLDEARRLGRAPKDAALNLNPLTASRPEKAWKEGYFMVLDEGADGDPRSHRGKDHPIRVTVYARVVQYKDADIDRRPELAKRIVASLDFWNTDSQLQDQIRLRDKVLDRDSPTYENLRSQAPRRLPELRDRPALTVGADEIAIQYWFLYMYNDFLNVHEGDWESITLFLDENQKPIHAAYANHEGGRRRRWEDVKVQGKHWDDGEDPTHPVVYVAAGSHGSYFQWPEGRGHMEAEIKLKPGIGRFRVGVRLTKREAFDRIPNPDDEKNTVRLGPDDYELVPIPIPQERDAEPEWDRLCYPEPDWAWLNHPRLCWGSRALLDAKGYGGPRGPASEHSEKERNWRWYNPWFWAYDTCLPDDLVFDDLAPGAGFLTWSD